MRLFSLKAMIPAWPTLDSGMGHADFIATGMASSASSSTTDDDGQRTGQVFAGRGVVHVDLMDARVIVRVVIWAAINEQSPRSAQQRCTKHKTMNVLDKLSKDEQPEYVPQTSAGRADRVPFNDS